MSITFSLLHIIAVVLISLSVSNQTKPDRQ